MNCFEVVGWLTVAYLAVITLFAVGSWIIRLFSSDILKPREGDYAVVTGATDGIGLEYARQLAKRGYRLLVLSRNEEKLQNVAQEIRLEYGNQCHKVDVLAVDFSQTDIYSKIREKIESLDGSLAVLVNNVGMVYHIPEYFANHPANYHHQLINVNVVSVTLMSEIALKVMVPQKRGIIINISSFAGLSEFPLFASYSASKSYINTLSGALATEYAEHGIVIQTVLPNQVKTKASRDLYDATISVSTEDYVRHALATVGVERQTSAHPKHKLINTCSIVLGHILGYKLFMRFKLLVGKSAIAKYHAKD